MKVGTDGVLLGAWTELRPADRRILDVGTGTGLIALMLAQRSSEEVRLTAVDIDPACTRQAAENVAGSPWSDRIGVVCSPVQEFASDGPFDLVVSNPPYYVDALRSPDAGRNLARHAEMLRYGELLEAAVRLMTPDGRLAVVLPAAEGTRFRLLAAERLFLRRMTEVRTTPRSGVRRLLMEFSRRDEGLRRDELVVETAPRTYTEAYRALTGDFYLKF